MTREEHFIKKTKLLAQIDSAEKLGCKNVLKYARAELAKTIHHPEDIVSTHFIMG